MTEATYTAWDGKLYEWPPPQGWYEALDGRWWPEGYGPRPEADGGESVAEPGSDERDGSVGEGPVHADLTDHGGTEVATTDDTFAGSTSSPSTGFEAASATADAGESGEAVPSDAGPSYASDPQAGSSPVEGSSWASRDTATGADISESILPADDDVVVGADAADLDQAAAAAAAAITGDHQPMTAWVAESAETSIADIAAEPQVESMPSSSEDQTAEWVDPSIDTDVAEQAESRDGEEDSEPADSGFGTTEAAAAGVVAAGAGVAGLTDLAGTTREPGSELFSRLQAEAEAQRDDIGNQLAAQSEAAGEAVTEAVPGSVSEVVPDAVSDSVSEMVPDSVSEVVPDSVSEMVPDSASEAVTAADLFEVDEDPTTEQLAVDSTSRSEFSGRFGSSRPGFTNSAYDEPAYQEPVYETGYERSATDTSVATGGSIGHEAASTDHDYDPQAYAAPGSVDAPADETSAPDTPSYGPGEVASAFDAPAYDSQALTDPGFGAPEQPPSLGYESPRAAVSPMAAPTPSVGPGRRILYAVLGVLALAAAGVAGYLAFQLQNDSDDGAEQSAAQGGGEAVIGSLANPHDPGSGIRIEYPDGAETQPWTLQLQAIESDGADGEARLTMQIVNDDVDGDGQLADLLLALVGADGNDLAPAPSPCGAGDSLDMASTVGAGQSVSGPVCWSVGGALPDDALLAVESTKAQGRVYISLP